MDIVLDIDAIDQAEEEHKHRKEEAAKLAEQQKIDARKRALEAEEAAKAAKPVDAIKPKSFPFGKKDLPPLRVRKNYEADPYRESVE